LSVVEMSKKEIRREEEQRRRRLGLLDTQRTPSKWSIPQHGETTTEPLFGADALQHRHTGRLPGSGLGTALCQQTVSAGGDFNECEMAVLRAAASGTRRSRSASGPKFEVSMHGQWKGLRGKGGAICQGAFVYPLFGNSSYEGSLVNGQRHGQGRQESHSGVYVGEFKEGDMSGSGRRIYCDGGHFEGEWLAGLKHGRGVFVLANGDAYNGEFRAGVMAGQGVYRFASGDVYRGSMSHDAMHGQGEYQYAATTKARYKGTFADNRRHGKGTFEFQEDGLTYSYAGEFVQDQQTGKAFLSISNGDTYAGTFLAGKYHGRGIYSFKDGSRYEGDFCAGMMHGQGPPARSHLLIEP